MKRRRWFWFIGVALLLYVLSVGPIGACLIENHGENGKILTLITAFYEPLNFMAEQVSPFGDVLGLYVSLFLPPTPFSTLSTGLPKSN
jgi:hypothetical protein